MPVQENEAALVGDTAPAPAEDAALQEETAPEEEIAPAAEDEAVLERKRPRPRQLMRAEG